MARIRASTCGKNDAVAAVVKDIDFRHLWRQLRAVGWTSRRPSGIQTDWRYVSPDGGNTFVGEDAVVVHAVESGLLGDAEDEETKDGDESVDGGDVSNDETAGEKNVRPSQIDTGDQLSQATLNRLLGSESEPEMEFSQTAVSRAFDVSPSELEAAESPPDLAINLHMLSEVSGGESEGAREDAPEVNLVQQAAARVLRPRIKNDVNYVAENENLDDYETFSSGESEDDGFDEGDDFDVRAREVDDDEVGEGDAAAMDETFVESLQIGSREMSRSATQQRTAALRGMEWFLPSGMFEENNEADYTRDKLWKLRPVVDKLQQRFLAGGSLPAVFSFDESVLPSTSKRNTTWMFIPDKPHSFEMYAGKRNAEDGVMSTFDHKTGAAAVIRNMTVVLESKPRHTWHLVVVDRFYSSILLAIELLAMEVYVVGTIMTNRLGFDKQVRERRKTQPAAIPRGSFLDSRSTAVPSMVAFHWWDRKPVHSLCTGSTMMASSIQRNQFSLQTSTRFSKYYKCLFLGFVDLAMVNAYIPHKETTRLAGNAAMERGDWFCVLQNQLLQLKAEDFAGVVVTPPPTAQKRRRTPVCLTHAVEQFEDWVTVSGVQKRRQRACKVCALLRTDPKKTSFATTYFCERCSQDAAKCWLCNKIRHTYKGETKTCFAIWHGDFNCGQSIPPTLGKKVVLRRPGKEAGPRKKTRRELQLRSEGAVDEGGENGNDSDKD
ncbi:hypothetical protein PHMEG_00012440 [Phytophthora megakarya]|uniref:PiggyBac transposable element-derived protein domain-containing protein n=1 Tax=Phytophthora megakarya TaxID=4795 RepID=A0A225W8Q5_9STRA|nr:hypothetical protein PHMEG_00012440 [Phytophthora megakarya]